MKVITATEAKSNLATYLRRAANGERILISTFGTPIAMLAPLDVPLSPRQPGALKGKIWIADHFDDLPFSESVEKIILGDET